MLKLNSENPEHYSNIATSELPLLIAKSGYNTDQNFANVYIDILAKIIQTNTDCSLIDAREEVKFEIGYNTMNMNKTDSRIVKDYFDCKNPILDNTENINSEFILKTGIKIGNWMEKNPNHTFKDLQEFTQNIIDNENSEDMSIDI